MSNPQKGLAKEDLDLVIEAIENEEWGDVLTGLSLVLKRLALLYAQSTSLSVPKPPEEKR